MEQYKRLRQRDGSGSVSKSAWRITVRQLESMIRLSEAMARMHCCDEVTRADSLEISSGNVPPPPFFFVRCLICVSSAVGSVSSCNQVQPKHVKEAFRLLNKSIIRVETPDINLEQEEDTEEEPQQEDGTVNSSMFLWWVHVAPNLLVD